MRPNLLSLDMDFRVIPSAVPLHSPSPDRKSINVITPTISPNAIEIKKGSTPIKNTRVQKQNYKGIHEMDTQLKYHSHSEGLSSALKQKDDIIKNLKNIIDMITDNSRYKKSDQSQLKNQVKILTIENQKLVNIIEKMSRNKNLDDHSRQNEQQEKINELVKKIKDNEVFHQQETKELKKFNKSLNTQLKNLQNEKRQLELENKKLLRILKQKNQGDRINSEKMKLSETSEQSIDEKMQTMSTNKSQQKLSLIKIRQQHSENLKILKEGLIKQIQETFDTMKIAIEGMNSKINGLAKRLESIQKMTWARVRKTHIERQSITISIREEEAHEGEETDRSFKLQKKNNSQIYIQQGPSSSHERASRDQFTRLEEIPSQKNLTAALQQQLAATKTELSQLRFKYEKLCLDTSSIGFSQKIKPEDSVQIEQEYFREVQKKDKEISILYEQVAQIEQENTKKLQQKDQLIAQKDQKLAQMIKNHQEEKEKIQKETQLKVRLLIQNYEKQLGILHRQILNSNKAETQKKGENAVSSQIGQTQYLKVQQKSYQLEELLKTSQLQVQALQQKYEYEHRILTNALQESEKNAQSYRAAKQELEQQYLVLTSQINQHRNYIESLKYELAAKNQQFENMKNLSSESEESYRKQMQNSKKLRELLIEREGQLAKFRKLLAEWSSNSLLGHLEQIHYLVEANSRKPQLSSESIRMQNADFELAQSDLREQRQQNHQLREHLIIKDELNTQLQARVSELQNLYQITKDKLKDQQDLYAKTIEKLGEVEQKLGIERLERGKEQEKWQSLFLSSKGIITKIDEVKKFQQSRIADIGKLLQGTEDRKFQ